MLAALVERIVDFIEPLYSVAGYAVIAGGVLAERSVFVGLIIPGDIILALGGVYSAKGQLALPLVILVASLAACVGESIGYWLGRRYGAALLMRLPFGSRMTGRLAQAEAFFRKNGGRTVAIGRFATAAGAFVPFVAGLSRMPYRRFLLFDVPAILVWAAGISIFGYVFGRRLDVIDRVLSRFGLIMLGLLAAVILGRLAWNRFRGRRKQGSGTDEVGSPKPPARDDEPAEGR
jgi:membrane protein DedA with SNARE-associated domain